MSASSSKFSLCVWFVYLFKYIKGTSIEESLLSVRVNCSNTVEQGRAACIY